MITRASGAFKLAPMSWDLAVMTAALLPLPILVGLSAGSVPHGRVPWPIEVAVHGTGYFLVVLYLWIWLWFRPTRFVVLPHAVEIVWPLRHRWLPRNEITAVRILDRRELKERVGRSLRVGAGGLWGGFGWLSTQKRGRVRMYISRTDRFVWIERGTGQPWLITPEEPEEFVRAMTAK
jgi:hypothetical protein